tara:strand:+ start:1680 stop:2561 length:882 start_codon:yes stop_codon:yes gene_type:complete
MINLGIIGYTEGNGHPYSYSSIFNGFDKNAMNKCPYKTIPEYLARHNSDHERINNAKITHIWTQDYEISKSIALAANISTIVNNPLEMIMDIDGVIIARDDYESHLNIAKPFIEAGINVFIDKPIAVSVNAAQEILNLEQFNGQIFTSSSLAFDPRVLEAKENLSKVGNIEYVYGSAPGIWENYAIHLIDSLIMIFGDTFFIENRTYNKNGAVTILNGELQNKSLIKLACMGGLPSPLRLTIVGDKGFFDIDFGDPYNAFKKTLETFTASIGSKETIRSHDEIIKSISLIQID